MPSASYPSLAGKGVYVTGGATGIGAELVRAFSRQGAKVAFVDLNEKAGVDLAKSVAGTVGPAPRFRVLDATDTAGLQADIRDAADDMGRLDVLLNNVANDTRHSPLEFTPEQWRKALAVNLDAAFFASQAAIPLLSKQERSAIVNFSSINALLGPANMPAYVAAKAGLVGLTKALAREFGPRNIRVNAILPGWVATERQLELWLTPEAEAEWAKLVCLPGRITEADIAALALFLGADDSAMITGQHFVVDAGRT
jgi:D-xylose 1-dehydrogenase